jgi:chorismate mutase / prephenate dehydratase
MADLPYDLEQLRRRIDEIDDRLHDLLIERMDVVSGVAAHKRANGALAPHQPAREAEIIRRLVGRHHGPLPAAAVVRMWRELLAAATRLQGTFTIAVYAPRNTHSFWDLARDHYGSQTPMLTFGSTAQVIRAVTEGQASVGVLPMPEEEERDPWWRHLLWDNADAPRVVARLPFGARANARGDGVDGLAIGHGPQLPTGRDRSFFAAENTLDISRGRIFSTLSGLGFTCTFMAACEFADGANTLIEFDGFVAGSDPRLERLRAQLGPALTRLVRFGGYAVPLSAAELARPQAAAPAALATAVARD